MLCHVCMLWNNQGIVWIADKIVSLEILVSFFLSLFFVTAFFSCRFCFVVDYGNFFLLFPFYNIIRNISVYWPFSSLGVFLADFKENMRYLQALWCPCVHLSVSKRNSEVFRSKISQKLVHKNQVAFKIYLVQTKCTHRCRASYAKIPIFSQTNKYLKKCGFFGFYLTFKYSFYWCDILD